MQISDASQPADATACTCAGTSQRLVCSAAPIALAGSDHMNKKVNTWLDAVPCTGADHNASQICVFLVFLSH